MSPGRLDAVLDLAGEAELLRHGHRDRLDALEHRGDADHARHQDRRERGLIGRAVASDALPDLGEHVEEHEAEQERLDQRADDEFPQVLAEHDQVAQQQRAKRGPTGGRDRAGRDVGDLRAGRLDFLGGRLRGYWSCHQSLSSLPVRLMKTVSRLGSEIDRSDRSKPPRSAASTIFGTRRSLPVMCSSTAPSASATRVLRTPSTSLVSNSASLARSPVVLTVTIVSASMDCFSAAGVSIARILPWSMIATRSQSRSASSM